ncbi:MAG: Unknown protein [uncultured Sulfurovum sp.]|uniref:Uncharacterized protein n=1 Tax=uncultured Sulfurovum sp. TaxID=269237 RepID=A0A6S6SLZ1_9BACT|nr:MAG: Unknown protein [uncultured Sulfurovum sp.]
MLNKIKFNIILFNLIKGSDKMRSLVMFSMIFVIIGCSGSRYQTPFSIDNPLIKKKMEAKNKDNNYLGEKAQSFINAYVEAKKNKRDGRAIRNYIDSGITYSHLLCNDYFERLSYTKAHRDFAQKETNLVGGLASGLMGLAQTSSSVLAGTGILFSFAGTSFDSYNESFLLSPNLSMLERLVKERQKEEEIVIYKKLNESFEKRWPNRIETLEQGERALSGYISHCTVNGIKTLLDAAVQNETTEVISNGKKIQKDTTSLPSDYKTSS